MAVNAPRAGIRAFSGGPFGIGWAPLAIGGLALVAGIFLFSRRRGAAAAPSSQAQPGSMPLTSQPSVNIFPFPTGAQGDGGGNISAGQLGGGPPNPGPTQTMPFPSAPPSPSSPLGTISGSLAQPTSPTFWRNPFSGAIYLVNPQGKTYIGGQNWAAIQANYGGKAAYTNVDPTQLAMLPDLPNVNLAA